MADILNTEKYLPPYTEIKLDLERGPPTMCILSPDEDLKVKIQVLEINMSCRRFVPNSVIALQNEKRFLSGGSIILPFTRTTIRYRTLHSGVLTTNVPGIFTGQLPYHFIVGILTNEQLSQMNYNPFIFKPHGLKKYNISKNGSYIPQEAMSVGDKDGSFLQNYTHFILNTGGRIFESSCDITPNEFWEKSFFISYDITPDGCMCSHNHKPENGVIDLNLSFNTPTTAPLTLLILASFENKIKIKKDEVVMNYTP